MATEWDEILAEKGVKPLRNDNKKDVEFTEQQIIDIAERAVEKNVASKEKRYGGKSLKELNELSDVDDEDERMILEYRRKRIQEIKQQMIKAHFGDVREISADNYVQEVNEAGPGVWVLLLLYETSSPICSLLQEHWRSLAQKFPSSKFLKSEAHLCIPNFPAKNLPAVFVYYEDDLKTQLIGAENFTHPDSSCVSLDELEWKLKECGAIESALTEKPKPKRTNIKTANGILLGDTRRRDSDESDDDW